MSMQTVSVQVMNSESRGARWRRAAARTLVAMATFASATNCTSQQTQGDSPAYLIIDALEGANGAEPEKFANTVDSDVLTFVEQRVDGAQVRVPTIFLDPGRVTLRLALKDPGAVTNPTQPSTTNLITVTRYRVQFVRADGRNTPGVDVPYPFDGAITLTVGSNAVSGGLVLVRGQAKVEAPLAALVGKGAAGTISTLAEVTFYGTDQAGRVVSVTGKISVDFADWGDPQ
jgi:hypothetical protein